MLWNRQQIDSCIIDYIRMPFLKGILSVTPGWKRVFRQKCMSIRNMNMEWYIIVVTWHQSFLVISFAAHVTIKIYYLGNRAIAPNANETTLNRGKYSTWIHKQNNTYSIGCFLYSVAWSLRQYLYITPCDFVLLITRASSLLWSLCWHQPPVVTHLLKALSSWCIFHPWQNCTPRLEYCWHESRGFVTTWCFNRMCVCLVNKSQSFHLRQAPEPRLLVVIVMKDCYQFFSKHCTLYLPLPRYWPYVRGIHRSAVNSPHKGQWRGALMFSLICVWINGWVNNREAGILRRHRGHYDVIVMLPAQVKMVCWLHVCCFVYWMAIL